MLEGLSIEEDKPSNIFWKWILGEKGEKEELEYNNQLFQIFKYVSLNFSQDQTTGRKRNPTQIATNKLEVFKDLVSIVKESAIFFGSFNIHF